MIKEIQSGGYKVAESNVIYLFDAYSDLRLHFNVEDAKFEFDIRLEFETNPSGTININKSATENEIIFKFTNFDNPFGSGTRKPIEIATVDDKKIFMQIWIYGVGKDNDHTVTRKVEYTVFVER